MKHESRTASKWRRRALFRWRAGIMRFGAQRSAATALEFAMVVPVFLVLVIETFQLGLYFYTSASLNYATSEAARQILTGAVGQQGLTAAQFLTNVLCPALPGSMSCANVVTNVVNVPEAIAPGGFYSFLNANQTGIAPPAVMENSQTSFCPGSTGSYVYLQVYYAMPVLSPIWMAFAVSWNGGNVHFVSASAAFKNEPFQSTTQRSC
jgi:Flp pilus assembly protein TadG